MDNVIYYGLLFAFALAGYLVKKYAFQAAKAAAELDPDTMNSLAGWALKLCRAAKNMIEEFTTGEQRREWVLNQITQICEKAGISLTDEQKRALLEAAYDEMKAEDETGTAALKGGIYNER